MTSIYQNRPSFNYLLDDLRFAHSRKSDQSGRARAIKTDEKTMMKAIIDTLIKSALIKKVLTTLAAMVVGAIVAYLTDIGLLDGSGADALAGILLDLAAKMIELF